MRTTEEQTLEQGVAQRSANAPVALDDGARYHQRGAADQGQVGPELAVPQGFARLASDRDEVQAEVPIVVTIPLIDERVVSFITDVADYDKSSRFKIQNGYWVEFWVSCFE